MLSVSLPYPRPPKILPWLARKARLSDNEATQLWQQAASEVAERVGSDAEEFDRLAMDRLTVLIAEAALQRKPQPPWLPRTMENLQQWLVANQLAYQLGFRHLRSFFR